MWKFKRHPEIDNNLWMEQLLKAEVSHVFFHPALMKVWMNTYTPIRSLEPIWLEAQSDGGNIALLPLLLWKRNWRQGFVRSIVPVGYSDYDYHDPLFLHTPTEEELDAFWYELLEYLQPFSADEIVLEGMRTSVIGKSLTWCKGEICPNKDLTSLQTEEQLMEFFSTKQRGDIRRQIRRLSEMGKLTLREFVSGAEVPEKLWEVFMDAHSRKWPNAYKAPGFHKRLLSCCSTSGPVHFSALMVGDTAVAWHLGFEFCGRYYYYMPCGNPDYLRQSPVKVHLYLLMVRAMQRGCKIFDHLRGDEVYKNGWSDGFTYVNTLTAKKSSVSYAMKNILLKSNSLIIKSIRMSDFFKRNSN